ncbi:MAG: hypothetical protein A2252_07595 [Elusimicrobia bacterium RIFOXYA2_FULL_39_19]|nr:MAG: hypothetical protein A2252_07595 [Elusimicrobia bacterium RIFOXYA2_FULL_39_19]
MDKTIKAAIIGLDTSHTLEFTERLQSPECEPEQKVTGMEITACLRFATPFQNDEGLDKRQKEMEGWGVKVTKDFSEAVVNCDAVMIEINDPSLHLEYFKKCAELGKPIFLDKPLADNIKNGKEIHDIVKKKNLRMFSASSLRFVPQLNKAIAQMPNPVFSHFYGPLGIAPAGSSIIWYGVHAFEMLEKAMGKGALSVTTKKDPAGIVSIVEYPEGRRGVVELREGAWVFGGSLSDTKKSFPFVVDMSRAYADLVIEVNKFFSGGNTPVALEDTLEVMALLDCAQRSLDSGKKEKI